MHCQMCVSISMLDGCTITTCTFSASRACSESVVSLFPALMVYLWFAASALHWLSVRYVYTALHAHFAQCTCLQTGVMGPQSPTCGHDVEARPSLCAHALMNLVVATNKVACGHARNCPLSAQSVPNSSCALAWRSESLSFAE